MRVLILALTILFATPAIAENPFDNESFRQTLTRYSSGFEGNFNNLKGAISLSALNRYNTTWAFSAKEKFERSLNAHIFMTINEGKYVHIARNVFPFTAGADNAANVKMLESVVTKVIPGSFKKFNGLVSYPYFKPEHMATFKKENSEHYYEIFVATEGGESFLVFNLVTISLKSPVPANANLADDIKILFESAKNKFKSQVTIEADNRFSSLTLAGVPSYVVLNSVISFEFFMEWFDSKAEAMEFYKKLVAGVATATGLELKSATGEKNDSWTEKYSLYDRKQKTNVEIEFPRLCADKNHVHSIKFGLSYYK